MPSPHPGIVPEESVPDEEVQPYTVRALVMNVVRGRDKWGNPDAYSYNRGDTIQLTPSYAAPYLKAGLLTPVATESVDDEPADDDPKPPRSVRNKAPSPDDDKDSQ